jgi:periplasmic protein CpxP/Spy
MESKHPAQAQTPIFTMKKQLAKLIPLLAIVIAAPAFADNLFSTNQERIAAGEMGERTRSNLNLTADQKTKIEQLKATTRSQIEAVLTPTQRQQYSQLQAQRKANRQGRQRMNLTADQKSQVKAIRAANKAQFRAILTPTQQAQLAQGGGRWRRGGAMTRLNLTPEQRAKMVQMRADARDRLKAVLTPEQQQQATARYERRQAMRAGWKSLNLTDDQKLKIRTIRQASRQQLDAILTPEQQSQRKSYRPRSGSRHNSV